MSLQTGEDGHTTDTRTNTVRARKGARQADARATCGPVSSSPELSPTESHKPRTRRLSGLAGHGEDQVTREVAGARERVCTRRARRAAEREAELTRDTRAHVEGDWRRTHTTSEQRQSMRRRAHGDERGESQWSERAHAERALESAGQSHTGAESSTNRT